MSADPAWGDPWWVIGALFLAIGVLLFWDDLTNLWRAIQ
jgi:hypothetical protein